MRTHLFAALALSLAACGTPDVGGDDFSDLDTAKADAFSKKMRLVGNIDYGDTRTVKYHNPPRYLAYSFSGTKGDDVELRVTSSNGDPDIWILDAHYKVVAHQDEETTGEADVSATLSNTATYFAVVRDRYLGDATFHITVNGTPEEDFYSCGSDSDCVAIDKGGCCPNGIKVAVNKSEVKAYEKDTACENPPATCPLYVIDDTRVAECNTSTKKCEMVDPSTIRCGGFTVNPHSCPSGWTCKYNSVPDVPGTCVQN